MPRTLAVLLATLALLAVGGALFFYSFDSRDGDGVVIAPLEVPREPVLASQPDGERRLVDVGRARGPQGHARDYAGLDELFWVTRRINKLHSGALVGGQ
jgi:hypothetical protein